MVSGKARGNYNSEDIVSLWTDFIDWEKRRAGEGGFLANVLRKNGCHKIFDASLGDGVDSIFLIKEGFEVTSNEIDKVFMGRAKENAEKEGIDLNITSYDWLELEDYSERGSFDAVICMGNSITYLFEEDNQLKVLRNFCGLSRDGGLLLIDERNYQYMLDNRREILGGDFRYSGDFVYCGEKVHGRPVEIGEELVKMEYTDTRNQKVGHLCLYPFRKGELKSLLDKTGFKKIEQYSDYSGSYTSEADFYQYVCVR